MLLRLTAVLAMANLVGCRYQTPPATSEAELRAVESSLKKDPTAFMEILAKDPERIKRIAREGLRRHEKDPLWPMALVIIFQSEYPRSKELNGDARLRFYRAWAEDLRECREALAEFSKDSKDPSVNVTKAQVNEVLASSELQCGNNLAAKLIATEMLKDNRDRKSWNYGNVVHNGHQLLGQVALREGDLKAAERELLAAGATPGSPQLNNFGPRFDLARELLQKGRKEVVLKYLDGVDRFWGRTFPANHRQLLAWKQQVGRGELPNDPKWR